MALAAVARGSRALTAAAGHITIPMSAVLPGAAASFATAASVATTPTPAAAATTPSPAAAIRPAPTKASWKAARVAARAAPHLAPEERQAAGEARRVGWLGGGRGSTARVAGVHREYCRRTGLPFVAVHRDGVAVVVDVGTAGARGVAAMSAALAGVVRSSAGPAAQVVNSDTLAAQRDAVAGAATPPREAANERKTPDAAPRDAYTVYVNGRAEALALARALAAAGFATAGRPTPADRASAAAARASAAAARTERLRLRRLRALVADPIATRNLRVPAGVLDGFIAAEKAGTTATALRAATAASAAAYASIRAPRPSPALGAGMAAAVRTRAPPPAAPPASAPLA